MTLLGGRVLEIAMLAPSGDEDDEPKTVRQTVSAERLSRVVSLLEETSSRNALLDPLAEQGADARRDFFFERARLGVADTPDTRPTAESTYAFVGIREKYNMVRSRESILPVEIVISGSLPDLGLGAFPRLRTPRQTPGRGALQVAPCPRAHAFQSVQQPIAMKPTPATQCSARGLTCWDTSEPASTPSAEVSTSAEADAAKTSHFGVSAPDAKSSVASCVLSPSSAMNTEPKIVAKSFQSTNS